MPYHRHRRHGGQSTGSSFSSETFWRLHFLLYSFMMLISVSTKGQDLETHFWQLFYFSLSSFLVTLSKRWLGSQPSVCMKEVNNCFNHAAQRRAEWKEKKWEEEANDDDDRAMVLAMRLAVRTVPRLLLGKREFLPTSSQATDDASDKSRRFFNPASLHFPGLGTSHFSSSRL